MSYATFKRMDSTALSPIFSAAPELPRGPHSLSREQVAESQRSRLLAAVTKLLAERGFAGLKVTDIARDAGVSLATFYEHFADKTECMFAAYEQFANALGGAAAVDTGDSWQEFVPTAIELYLSTLDRDPVATRAFFVEFDAAGPAARQRRTAGVRRLAALVTTRYAEFRARDPSLGPVDDAVFFAVAIAIRGLVYESLVNDPEPHLGDLVPVIVTLIGALTRGQ